MVIILIGSELYNAGSTAVDLQGYALTDNPDSLRKYIFHRKPLPPVDFSVYGVRGKKTYLLQVLLHIQIFSLSSQGESIYFSDPSGIVLDNVPPVYLPADKAMDAIGRIGSINLFVWSTPGASNDTVSIVQGVILETRLQFARRILSRFTLSHLHRLIGKEVRYTLDGSDPTSSSPLFSSPLFIKTGMRIRIIIQPFVPVTMFILVARLASTFGKCI